MAICANLYERAGAGNPDDVAAKVRADGGIPDAQMVGDTSFALGILPDALPNDLMRAWERFALPLLSVEAPGGGSLPGSGSLLDIDGAELSSVRRKDGEVELRLWNPSNEPRSATVEGRTVQLAPAEIVTEHLDRW
jgi:hypothetical protein